MFRDATDLGVGDKRSIDDLDAAAPRREEHVDGDAPIQIKNYADQIWNVQNGP